MSEENKKRPVLKIAILIVAGILLAAIITGLLLGGYTPFYRTFLQAAKQPHFADHIEGIEGIKYVARVNENFYRGAYPSGHLDQLQKLGIKTIVNFRYSKEHDYREEAESAGFNYHYMPINPREPPSKDEIKQFLEIVSGSQNQPVYVHCTLGIDRTGLMSGIYRIEFDGWDNQKAVDEMEYFGHNEFWHDLEERLKKYKRSFDYLK
jgi:protein tyrosine/serine phosphatase